MKRIVLLLACATAIAADIDTLSPNSGELRIVPVDSSPEADHVDIRIAYPEMNEVKSKNPVSVQIRIEGFPLGTNTQLPRAKEIWNDPHGQTLHIFIDNEPYFSINEAIVNSLDDDEDYYEQHLDFKIPTSLKPGLHVIRVLPVRSYNECLKGDGVMATSVFYLDTKRTHPGINLHKPYLTYNEPQGDYDMGEPILLDFFISNCQLSRDGYKVRVTIDGNTQRILSSWTPYYIYGLKKGAHRVQLELLDRENNPVMGMFNNTTRNFTIL